MLMTLPPPILHSLVLGTAIVVKPAENERALREEFRDWLQRLNVQGVDSATAPVLQDMLKGDTQETSCSLKTEEEREWMNADEAARYLRISKGALRNMTSNGHVPHFKLGRRVRYRVSELQALLLGNRRGGV